MDDDDADGTEKVGTHSGGSRGGRQVAERGSQAPRVAAASASEGSCRGLESVREGCLCREEGFAFSLGIVVVVVVAGAREEEEDPGREEEAFGGAERTTTALSVASTSTSTLADLDDAGEEDEEA